MENYIVSARKYRPSTFESVVGQRALTTTLKNAIATQKLAHAYLFCGPRGVGKTTCARIFAKTINCMTPTADGEACNQCESCVAFNEQRSYNIHELDAASNNSVDDIRQLVEQVRIPPQIGKYKVYDVFVSTQEKLKKFNISCDNHTVLTYKNLSEKFSSFSNEKANFGFISGYNDTNSMFNYPMQLFNRFINNYVDFENKVTYFESDDFKSKLDTMCRLLNASKEDFPDFIFDDLYINRSLSLMVRKYAYYKSENETPVICRGLVKSDNDYSAFVQVGFGINSNTHFEKQAYAFLKFALSEDVQTKMCGAKGISYSANISFPVNKKAFEQAKYSASKQADDDGKIIGIDNDFMKAYIDIADNVNACTLYQDVSHSYYNDNVIGDIVDNYINKGITKEKFIRQLSAATEIYLTE